MTWQTLLSLCVPDGRRNTTKPNENGRTVKTSAIDKDLADVFVAKLTERLAAGASASKALNELVPEVYGVGAKVEDFWWTTTASGLYRPCARKKKENGK